MQMEIKVGGRYTMEKAYHRGPNAGMLERFPVTVTWIEDRGNRLYIGYKPDNLAHGRFRAVNIFKDAEKNRQRAISTILEITEEVPA